MRAMRAERFGSYSIPTTSAEPPRLRRLKSTLRYLCLCPPPICRDGGRPWLWRPPVFFFGSISLLSGRHFVISSKAGSDLKRSVGVRGRNSFKAISVLEHRLPVCVPSGFVTRCSNNGQHARWAHRHHVYVPSSSYQIDL